MLLLWEADTMHDHRDWLIHWFPVPKFGKNQCVALLQHDIYILCGKKRAKLMANQQFESFDMRDHSEKQVLSRWYFAFPVTHLLSAVWWAHSEGKKRSYRRCMKPVVFTLEAKVRKFYCNASASTVTYTFCVVGSDICILQFVCFWRGLCNLKIYF